MLSEKLREVQAFSGLGLPNFLLKINDYSFAIQDPFDLTYCPSKNVESVSEIYKIYKKDMSY